MSHAAAPGAPGASPPAFWLSVAMALLAIAGFVASRPTIGIVHDNVLYVAQALRWIDPTILNRDLFFAHGSQDSFTLFSPLYGGLIGMLGIGGATLLLLVSGLALWLAAAWWLIRLIVPPRFVWLALLFVATYPAGYGGDGIFHIAEPFVTPRLFGEALGIGALAAFLAGRGLLSAVLLAAAAVLHPLVAAPPAAVIVVTALLGQGPARLIATTVAVASLLLLAVLAAGHTLHLPVLPTIDTEWAAIAADRSPHLFIARWSANDWMSFAADALLIGLAIGVAKPPVQRLLVAALAIGAASIVVTVIGFDLLGDLRIGQLQVWRALWLLKVLAPVSLVLIICDAGRRHGILRLPILLLVWTMPVFASISEIASAPGLLLPPLVLLAILCVRDRGAAADGDALGRLARLSHLVYGLFCGLALVLLGKIVITLATQSANFTALPVWQFMLQQLLPLVVLAAGLGLFASKGGRWSAGLAAAALVVLCATLLVWDQRNAWQRYVYGQPGIGAALATPVAPEEQVYWPGNVIGVWVGMNRASYVSRFQGAGVIFNRDTALEYRRRMAVVDRLERGPRPSAQADTTLAKLLSTCQQPDGPDVVVLDENLPAARPQAWRSPVVYVATQTIAPPGSAGEPTYQLRRVQDFFFYRCSDVRAGAG